MTLFTRNGETPAPLPFRAYDETGRAWTDLANNPEGIEACGFAEAPEPPAFDPARHRLDWDGAAWVLAAIPPLPPPAVDEVREQLLAALAQRRWEVETGGIVRDGVPIATDDRSKLLILGKRTKAMDDPEGTTRWKAGAGQFVELPNAAVIATADTVEAHVQACFDHEADLTAAINAAAAEDGRTDDERRAALAAIGLDTGWPA